MKPKDQRLTKPVLQEQKMNFLCLHHTFLVCPHHYSSQCHIFQTTSHLQ
jgi:hypothetical protein